MSDPAFQGFASGWFLVCFSEELAVGEVKPVTFFGKELVLFRTASGQAKVLDAYCPHMGAHLGYGGLVEGESVRCPFHAWEFNGDGECTTIPYATKIPPRAKIDCWPVDEHDGMLFVWHDRAKGAPTWNIPAIEGHGTPDWTPWSFGQIIVKTHPREIVENVVDVGHFIPVHGTHVDTISNEFVDHMATQINSGTAYPLGGGKDKYSLRATYHGPGWQYTHMKGYLESHLINAHTPIDENTLLLRFAVSVRKRDGIVLDEAFLAKYVENLRQGFFQDIRIWENMHTKDHPVLCDADGPLIKLRQWYRTFYQPEAKRLEALHG